MSDVIVILGVAALIGWVIVRQMRGEALRARRVLLLPAVLVGYALVTLSGEHGVGIADVSCLALSAVLALVIGAGQGFVMRLENRDGGLWGQLPRRGLWLWAALIASRVLVTVIAVAIGAHVATSTDSIILALGINRLAQAGVITLRAMAAGIPFAPEQDHHHGRFGQA
jgi:hypothetical protein